MANSLYQTSPFIVMTWLLLSLPEAMNNSGRIPYSSLYTDSQTRMTYTRLHKCYCSSSQVLAGEMCLDRYTTITALMDEISLTTQEISTERIQEIIIEDLKCPPGHIFLTLPGDTFALRTSGKLFNTGYGLTLEFSNYCAEHTLGKNDEMTLQIRLCLPIPKVPLCCSFNESSDCIAANNSLVTVPFNLGKKPFQMKTKSFPNELTCNHSLNVPSVRLSKNWDSSQTARLKLTNEGLILAHKTHVFGSTVYIPSPNYCLTVDEKDGIVSEASYCSPDPIVTHHEACKDRACFRKCCALDEIFDMINMGCIPVAKNDHWFPKFYKPLDPKEEDHPKKIFSIVGFPIDCEFFSASPNNDPPDNMKLLSNGSLYLEDWRLAITPEQYCIDSFMYSNAMVQEAFVCFQPNEEASSETCRVIEGILYPSLILTSCLFLVTTLIVYAIIPDLHVTVQGKCLMASILSLLMAYIFLVIVQLGSHKLNQEICVIIGLLLQYSILASFFWLNVMCFDIWRTLRLVRSERKNKAASRRRFLKYSAYAWGTPLAIALITSLMQYLPHRSESHQNTSLILPQLGETGCFFPRDDQKALWVYFYGFVSIILIVNLTLFADLAIMFIKARKIQEFAQGKKKLHKEWAKLYLKLFLIMGITWIFEVTSVSSSSCVFWIVTDIINALRGMLIFIIFVCKRDVIRKLLSESNPTFHRMNNLRQSSISFFLRSTRRTSSVYIDPSSISADNRVTGTNENEEVTK